MPPVLSWTLPLLFTLPHPLCPLQLFLLIIPLSGVFSVCASLPLYASLRLYHGVKHSSCCPLIRGFPDCFWIICLLLTFAFASPFGFLCLCVQLLWFTVIYLWMKMKVRQFTGDCSCQPIRGEFILIMCVSTETRSKHGVKKWRLSMNKQFTVEVESFLVYVSVCAERSTDALVSWWITQYIYLEIIR